MALIVAPGAIADSRWRSSSETAIVRSRSAAEFGLVVPQFPPLDFEQQLLERVPLDRAQPLPDEIFHVVLEEHDRHVPAEGNIWRRKQKIRDDQIDLIFGDDLLYLAREPARRAISTDPPDTMTARNARLSVETTMTLVWGRRTGSRPPGGTRTAGAQGRRDRLRDPCVVTSVTL